MDNDLTLRPFEAKINGWSERYDIGIFKTKPLRIARQMTERPVGKFQAGRAHLDTASFGVAWTGAFANRARPANRTPACC
jgi:hypothetical protein